MAAHGGLKYLFNQPLNTPPAIFNPKPIPGAPTEPFGCTKPLTGSPTNVLDGFNLTDSAPSSPTSSVATEPGLLFPDHHRRSSVTSDNLSEYSFNEEYSDDECRRSFGTTRMNGIPEILPVEPRRSRVTGKVMPPPVSYSGRRGCFKSFRSNGRLVIKEVKIPAPKLLHVVRENGRLRLQIIRFDDEAENKRENGEYSGEIRKES